MHKPCCWFAIVVASLLLGAPGAARAAVGQWQAGAARVNITPELPIWLQGYGVRDRPATTKHDDLWTKALVVEDAAGNRAVLVTADLASMPRDVSTAVCEAIEDKHKLQRSAIAVCASHTHSGPVVRENLIALYSLDADQGRRVKEYKAALIKKMVSVVDAAFKELKPAKLSWGIGKAEFAVNRRNNPEGKVPQLAKDNKLVGPVDHALPVLAVHGDDGKLLAVVGGYACHATVLGDYFISADWPGAAQNELERRHPSAVAMFVAGCGGDQNPLPRRSIALMEKYGQEFADGVDAVLKSSLKPIAPKLATAYEEIDLPLATPPTRAELELSTKKEKPEAAWAKYMLNKWDQDGELITHCPYPVEAWRLGNQLTWVLLGGEVVVDYSLRLKSELGTEKTWISSYSNDVMAYIPSRRVLGEGGYEGGLARFAYGLPAPWDASIEQKIVDEAHKLSNSVIAAGDGAAKEQTNGASERGWTPLFDGKSLHGWYPQIQNHKTNDDPEKYFQVDDGMIHVYKGQAAGTAVPNGYLATDGVYANFHLRMEYKWGEKKFKPRMNAVRDAGLLYHVTPPDSVWPRCVECQIQEGDVGDCFTVRGVRLTTSVEVVPIKTPGGVKNLPRYKADGGEARTLGDSGIVRIVKSSTHERDGWNTVELVVRGSHGSEHIVNGEMVFRAKELQELGPQALSTPLKKGEVDKREWQPLSQGRIALQCEYSEVFYRKIEIRAIPDGALEAKAK